MGLTYNVRGKPGEWYVAWGTQRVNGPFATKAEAELKRRAMRNQGENMDYERDFRRKR